MALDTMTVTSSGPSVGEIVCRGRLVDREGRLVAGYVQTVRGPPRQPGLGIGRGVGSAVASRERSVELLLRSAFCLEW